MTAADVVGVCDVPAVFNFKANEVYRFYFNGRLMGVSPTNPTAGVSNLKTVSLPRVPQCGDVIGIHSEVRNSASLSPCSRRVGCWGRTAASYS